MARRRIVWSAAAMLLSGCTGVPLRSYDGAVPHAAAERDVRLETAKVFATKKTVIVQVNFDMPTGTALTAPRLAQASSTACSDGIVPSDYNVNHNAGAKPGRDVGSVVAQFSSDDVRRAGLLEREPASMAIEVIEFGEGSARTCHRVPVVSDIARVEWENDKVGTLGVDLRFAVPTSSALSKMPFATFVAIRGGLYLGPLRLSGDLFLGYAFGGPTSPKNSDNSYGMAGGGLSLDALIAHGSGFGLGLQAGAEALSLVFDPAPTVTFPHRSYFLIGPRGGLRFVWFGPELPGRAFHARTEAITTSIALYTSVLHDADTDVGWVPMI
ncbi:MAG TPA: hypothetical protein VNO21_23055, partial [Polyangiaceae bacterium]|nr:hypothetical protein [Polyangiaceae bacterium]